MMVEDIIKLLYFYIFVFSCLGFAVLLKREFKKGLLLLLILSCCLGGRLLWKYSSLRYYSVLLFGGIFLSSYGIDFVLRKCSHIYLKKSFFILFLLTLLFIHSIKCFSGFNDKYISDLQETVNNNRIDSHNTFWIIRKEFLRLSNTHYDSIHKQIKILDDPDKTTNIFLEHCYYSNNVFFILSENKSSFLSPHERFQLNHFSFQYKKTGHFISNKKHNKFISIYQYTPEYPVPEIKLPPYLEHAVLKAYVPEYNAFIYHLHDKIVWLIKSPVNPKTEAIYHLYTDHPELLPPARRSFTFDNLGFSLNKTNEKDQIGDYHIFEKNIPSEYPILFFRTGFNTGGKAVWRIFAL